MGPKHWASNRVYDIVEMLNAITSMCNWTTLLDLANSSCTLRTVSQHIMCLRVKEFLCPFIGNDFAMHNWLFNIMMITKSAITGALVHCMLLAFTDRMYLDTRPTQLDIVIPYANGLDVMGIWIRFFSNLQYTASYDNSAYWQAATVVKRTLQMYKEVRLFMTHHNRG